VRTLPHPATADLELSTVLHALGDPIRLELVRRLAADGETTCTPLAMTVPKSTLSNHWRILREAGLTSTVVDGRTRRIQLRTDDLDARFPGLLAVVLGGEQAAAAARRAGSKIQSA
jgi:DNA-binding transcriptional ArsR family regulator